MSPKFPRLEKNQALVSVITFILGLVLGGGGMFYRGSNHIEVVDNSKKEQKQITHGPYSPAVIGDGNIFNYKDINNPNYINERTIDLLGLQPKDLVWQFFELQNKGGDGYRQACSLLQRKKSNQKGCNSADGNDVDQFSSYVKGFLKGYENLYIVENEENSTEYSKILCIRFDYTPNNKTYDGAMSEFWRYKLTKREDNEREISSRTCEDKISESQGNKDCGDNESLDKICLPYLQS